MSGKIDFVLGLQRGDEGKGRVIDELAEDYSAVVRFNGGPNAGHTIVADGLELALHQIPSGVLYPRIKNIIAGTSLVDPQKLSQEIQYLSELGVDVSPKNLIVHYGVHLILPHHVMLDTLTENGERAQGSTKQGIRYTARDKAERVGVRFESLNDESFLKDIVLSGIKQVITSPEALEIINLSRDELNQQPIRSLDKFAKEWASEAVKVKSYTGDALEQIKSTTESNKDVLAEGAQGHWLDIDLGQYPFVTSTDTTIYGAMKGLGASPKQVDRIFGVAKLTESHVGDGVFVTEVLAPALAERLRGDKNSVDGEYGKTSGRPRRMGYPDLVRLRTAVNANHVTDLVLTKLDWLPRYGESTDIAIAYEHSNGSTSVTAPSSDVELRKYSPKYASIPLWKPEELSGAKHADELPQKAHKLIEFISSQLDVQVSYVGVGPERGQLIKYNR